MLHGGQSNDRPGTRPAQTAGAVERPVVQPDREDREYATAVGEQCQITGGGISPA